MMKLMMASTLALLVQTGVASAQAAKDMWSEISNVVVEKSIYEGDYALYFSYRIQGVNVAMSPSASCNEFDVIEKTKEVVCISSRGERVVVATLDKEVGQEEEWVAISLKWNGRAQLARKQSKGRTYSTIEVVK